MPQLYGVLAWGLDRTSEQANSKLVIYYGTICSVPAFLVLLIRNRIKTHVVTVVIAPAVSTQLKSVSLPLLSTAWCLEMLISIVILHTWKSLSG